ncbi:MAG: AMP-binding protein [Rhodospirillaceae bacterium]|nr:AMP-binding protein [Rhodospirillaceae bacterium]MBL6929859.1 AMP-binding protein [Rhodospirillales bacterium]MBL6941628.1 AMP-binding protein [Rhodospirillales bacterium]
MHKVLSALRKQAKDCPDRIAFSDGERRVGYDELEAMTNAVASGVRDLPDVIAILAPNGIDWVAGWLGLARAGKTIVTLPPFFSKQQLDHIVGDSTAAHVICSDEMAHLASSPGLPISLISDHIKQTDGVVHSGGQPRLIVYTSGTTGAPKGVRLSAAQVDWSAAALKQAVDAGAEDHYLSVLPFALLLEQICGICVSVLAGAHVTIACDVATSLMAGDPSKLASAMERTQPTISVLVPEFLAAWVAFLSAQGGRAPENLRFVAVGGAPLAPAMVVQAVNLGIPVQEGYGLTECCSVVALSRPGERLAGSVGKPLDGLDVTIVDGEIVVSGPSVMDGYLHGEAVSGCWHTGDLGSMDEEGNLHIMGRLDNLLVLANGRNVSPEWIEAMIASDSRIAGCSLEGHGQNRTRVSIIPSLSGARWFAAANPEAVDQLIAELCHQAPDYARPGSWRVISQPDLATG